MAENRIENSKIKHQATMKSDVANTKNIFRQSEADRVDQEINNREEGLSLLGFGRAKGRYAVIALVVIAICYLLYRLLVHSA
jgi:hypothetical protein